MSVHPSVKLAAVAALTCAAASSALAGSTTQEQIFKRLWADHLPDYCLYTQLLPDGEYGLFGTPTSKEFGKTFGEATFRHLHHYCFGLEKTYLASQEQEEHLRIGLYRSAVNEFDYVLDRSPDDFVLKPEIYVNKGSALEILGLYADAVTAYTRALEIAPTHVPAYIGLSNCFESLGDKARARAIVEAGLRQSPNAESLVAKREALGEPTAVGSN